MCETIQLDSVVPANLLAPVGAGGLGKAEGKCPNEMAIELDSRRTENASCVIASAFKR
jgi:hypothetical protein